MAKKSYGATDSRFIVTMALPELTYGLEVYSDAIDLCLSDAGLLLADCELEITIPALTEEEFLTTDRLEIGIVDSDSKVEADYEWQHNAVWHPVESIRGEFDGGHPGVTLRHRICTDTQRYVRVYAGPGPDSSGLDLSAKNLVARLLF